MGSSRASARVSVVLRCRCARVGVEMTNGRFKRLETNVAMMRAWATRDARWRAKRDG